MSRGGDGESSSALGSMQVRTGQSVRNRPAFSCDTIYKEIAGEL